MKKIRIHHEREGLSITALREIKVLKALSKGHPNMVELIEVVTSKAGHAHEIDGYQSEEEDEENAKHKKDNTQAKELRVYKGSIFLVLEYVDHDLSGLLDSGKRFDLQTIKCIMMQLLRVLEYMHKHEYVHRDIKCSNLLMNNRHQLKLADFGLTRRIKPDGPMTNKVITL